MKKLIFLFLVAVTLTTACTERELDADFITKSHPNETENQQFKSDSAQSAVDNSLDTQDPVIIIPPKR